MLRSRKASSNTNHDRTVVDPPLLIIGGGMGGALRDIQKTAAKETSA